MEDIKEKKIYDENSYPSPEKSYFYLQSLFFSSSESCKKYYHSIKHKKWLWPFLSEKEELSIPLSFIHAHFKNPNKKIISLKKNIFYQTSVHQAIKKKLNHSLYLPRNKYSAIATMGYLIKKIGDFVFYAIKDNKLVAFIRYFDPNWKNDWTRPIHIKNFKTWKKEVSLKTKNITNALISDKEYWRPEGCAVWLRQTNIPGYKGFFVYLHYFLTLCKKRNVPDSIGFINLYEHPILREDKKEPFPNFYLPQTISFPSSLFPILSPMNLPNYLDITLPVPDQWEYVSGLSFPSYCRSIYEKHPEVYSWNLKKNTLFFRGAITGCFHDERNPRIKLIKLSETWKKNPKRNNKNPIDNTPYLNASFTKNSSWDTIECYYPDGKPDISCQGNGYSKINIIQKSSLANKKQYVPQWKQSEYKYLLSIEGTVAPWREPYLLDTGSLLIRAETPFTFWYEPLLKPLKHYVPTKRNLTDLASVITWCKLNDKICKKISNQAKTFHEKYLSYDATLDYLQLVLSEIM
jgi:hypothetical protein